MYRNKYTWEVGQNMNWGFLSLLTTITVHLFLQLTETVPYKGWVRERRHIPAHQLFLPTLVCSFGSLDFEVFFLLAGYI